MAQFEIDIDSCLKNRKVFIVTNASKTLKKFVMASFLGELQWEAKEKLGLNMKSKILLSLEKDGTPVDNEELFKKMEATTELIAKEVSIQNDNHKNIPKPEIQTFKNVQIKQLVKKTNFGLKIIGCGKSGNVFISEIGSNGSAFYDSSRKLEVGQQIRQINGESLIGKDYSEIVEIIRRTKDTHIVDLFVTDLYPKSRRNSIFFGM